MHPRVWLTLIFLLALGIRLTATVLFEGLGQGPRRDGFSDGVEFNAIATNLVTRGEFAIEAGQPTSFRAPGFSLVLAGIYSLAGVNNFLAFRLVQCLVGAMLVLVVYGLGKQLAGPTVGLVAAALTAVYPNIFYYTIHFSSEPLYTLLLAAATLLFLAAGRHERQRVEAVRSPGARGYTLYALAGLLLGAAALTRPLAFYFFPLFALLALWTRRTHWRGVVLYCLAVVVVIAPWTIRNHCVHDRFLLLASNGGSTFWGSNNAIVLTDPAHRGGWISTERMPEQKAAVRALTNEVDRDRLEWQLGKQFLRENPTAIPRLAWYKFREFWTPFCKTPNKKFNLIILVSYAPLLPFMLGGIFLACRCSHERQRVDSPTTNTSTGIAAGCRLPAAGTLTLLIPITMTVLGTLAFYGAARFRSSVEPFLLVFAALALTRTVSRFASGRNQA